MTTAAVAKNVLALLRVARKEWDALPAFKSEPTLMARFASQLAYGLGDRGVDYLTVRHDADDNTLEAVAFSGKRIVWVIAEAGEELTTYVHSTSEIQEIRITSAPNYLSVELGGGLPVRAIVIIDGTEFPLPGDAAASDANRDALDAFLPNLFP